MNDTQPVIERWMYGNNSAPCDRPAGSTFGTSGDGAGVDTRHAQHLLGWDTASVVPANRGTSAYLLRRCRVTLTINRGNLFAYDPTQDDFRTYFDRGEPGSLPDTDEGRPIEMFGVGFRNGFDAASFDQCAPFGTNAPAQRNAFAAGASTNGVLVDVSNNVGKTNQLFPRFEVAPFAIGRTRSVEPGQLVPAGAKITFDLNLDDPFVLAYLQDGLNHGRLRFMVSSLHGTGGQFGTPAYPDFVTHFNDVILEPTRLELDGLVVREIDTDADGLPDDWEQFHLYTLGGGAAADSDGDGVDNLGEWRAGTNPANPASVLRVSSSSRDAAGHFHLTFPHAANRQYWIEFSPDFKAWTPVTNDLVFQLGTGMAEWTERATGLGTRFFRVGNAATQ